MSNNVTPITTSVKSSDYHDITYPGCHDNVHTLNCPDVEQATEFVAVNYSRGEGTLRLMYSNGFRKSSAELCGQWSFVGTHPDGSISAHTGYCKSWVCPTCAKLLRKQWKEKLLTAAPIGILTLTYQGEEKPFRDALNKLQKRLKLKSPDFQYACIVDRCHISVKSEWRATYFILSDTFPKEEISAIWTEYGGSEKVQRGYLGNKLTREKAISYALSGQFEGLAYHKRRINMSRGFRKIYLNSLPDLGPAEEHIEWQIWRMPLRNVFLAFMDRGYTERDSGPDWCIMQPPVEPPPKKQSMRPGEVDAATKLWAVQPQRLATIK